MTIRFKLTMNVVLITAVIGILFAASFLAMKFVKTKLSYLTEKSTPFQLKTIELQRSIQAATSDFITITVASSTKEFSASKAEAEKTLQSVRDSQQALEAMSAEKSSAYADLEGIYSELVQATGNRLAAQDEAARAATIINQRQKETGVRLKNLDRQIKALQEGRSNSYATSAEAKDKILNRVRSLEMMKTNLKELKLAIYEVSQKSGKTEAASALLNKIGQNSFVRGNQKLAGEVKLLAARIGEIGRPGGPKEPEILAALDELIEQATDEGDKEDDRYAEIASRQGAFQTQAKLAVNSMAGNSELVALGLAINGLVTRLFVVTAPAELDAIAQELNEAYARIATLDSGLRDSLRKNGASREMAELTGAVSSLNTIRGLLFSSDGVLTKLRRSMEMQAKAAQVSLKLREIVVSQMEQGKKTVGVAQGEQEKSIASVNRIVRLSMTGIGLISLFSIVAGLVFGAWIYRSISKPLGNLLDATGQIARGDLTGTLDGSGTDEVGQVQTSVGQMIQALRSILLNIHGATDTLAASSYRLTGTANALESGAQRQEAQISQVVTAIAEMSQSSLQMAHNTTDTADAAGQMKELARSGQEAMHRTVTEMNNFSRTAQESADRIMALGRESEQIGEVVSFIKDIADQTNLLALNASIEAARAGDMGRGFAVVADNVRQLAERTNTATDDICTMVKNMQSSISTSIRIFQEEQDSLGKVVGNVEQTLAAIDSIAAVVDQVEARVREMSVAADEQTAVSDEINSNVIAIEAVTREVSSCFSDIKESAEGLSTIAAELKEKVEWFRIG